MQLNRILMTVDAVGGVWRYALDLARGLSQRRVETVFVGVGPEPDAAQRVEAERLGQLRWLDLPLDWMAREAAELQQVPGAIAALAHEVGADLIHLNLPSQAAGIVTDLPVVAVSHSCVVTWFDIVRGADVPESWNWQRRLNRAGLLRADAVVAPSRAHADLLARCYDGLRAVEVVPNAVGRAPAPAAKQPYAYAAARWWDEGKNAAGFDAAAASTDWPVLAFGAVEGPSGQRIELRHARSMGQVDHAHLREAAAAAGIFVSPSLYEPFGLAALEAAQAGAALVLADIPSYRENWSGAALFADPRDPGALAAAMNRLAGDADLRSQLAAAARARVARFTPERQADAMLAVYARHLALAEGVA